MHHPSLLKHIHLCNPCPQYGRLYLGQGAAHLNTIVVNRSLVFYRTILRHRTWMRSCAGCHFFVFTISQSQSLTSRPAVTAKDTIRQRKNMIYYSSVFCYYYIWFTVETQRFHGPTSSMSCTVCKQTDPL